jgi:DNA-binding NarL/FixJ family response regulator
MNKVKILVVDDHALIRQGIRAVFQPEQKVHIVAEATTGLQMLEETAKVKPNIVIMDLPIPGLDGVEATRRICTKCPGTAVLIVNVQNSTALVRGALDAGARGYVLNTDLASELRAAIEAITEGRRYLSHAVAERLADEYLEQSAESVRFSGLNLTTREVEVAELLGLGKSSKQIAAALGLSVRTVETHRANIMRKLNVHSVTELLHYALEKKLINNHRKAR